jgi:hypothetical protein
VHRFTAKIPTRGDDCGSESAPYRFVIVGDQNLEAFLRGQSSIIAVGRADRGR